MDKDTFVLISKCGVRCDVCKNWRASVSTVIQQLGFYRSFICPLQSKFPIFNIPIEFVFTVEYSTPQDIQLLPNMAPTQTKALINVDMGEGYGNYVCGPDRELLPMIDHANVACGFQ